MNARSHHPLSLEVITLFRGTVLDVHHLDPGERFTVGPDAAHLPLEHPALDGSGEAGHAIARVDDAGNARVDPLAGCSTTVLIDGRVHRVDGARGLRLVPGQKARVEVGDTTLLFSLVHRAPVVPRAPISLLDRDGRRFMGAAAALHAVLLALAFAVPVQAGSLSMDGFEMKNRWVEVMLKPVDDKPEDLAPQVAEVAEETGGGPEIPVQQAPPQWVEPATEASGGQTAKGTAEDERARKQAEALAAADAVNTLVADLGPDLGAVAHDAFTGMSGDRNGDALAMGGSLRDGFGGPGVAPRGHGGPSVGPGAITTNSRKRDKTYGGGPGIGPRVPKKPTTKIPEIVPLKPIVAGGLDREQIQRAIRTQRNAIRHCYEKALQTKPDLQGKVRTKFVIGADGRVLTAAIVDSTMGDGDVDRCIAQRVKRVKFPQVRGGGAVVVTYPFLFRSGR